MPSPSRRRGHLPWKRSAVYLTAELARMRTSVGQEMLSHIRPEEASFVVIGAHHFGTSDEDNVSWPTYNAFTLNLRCTCLCHVTYCPTSLGTLSHYLNEPVLVTCHNFLLCCGTD